MLHYTFSRFVGAKLQHFFEICKYFLQKCSLSAIFVKRKCSLSANFRPMKCSLSANFIPHYFTQPSHAILPRKRRFIKIEQLDFVRSYLVNNYQQLSKH